MTTKDELQAAMDRPGFGTGRAFADQKQQEADALALLPAPAGVMTVRASSDPTAGWLICSTGNSSEDGDDWHVITDDVHASDMVDAALPADAKSDAYIIAAIINCYRMGLLVRAEETA